MPRRSMFRRMLGPVVGVLCAALLVAIVVGSVYEQRGERLDRQRIPQVGHSVDIGGRTLNIFCSGEESPTVIFDSGAGQAGFAWSDIQPEIAKLTRACWFDRAGYGWSDPGPFPRTSAATAGDLHELLRRANVPPPYVLVGHSLGGLDVRVYNGFYLNEVAGAVLVDAAHEDEPRRAPKFMLGHTAPRFLWHPIWTVMQGMRRVGLLRVLSPRVALPDDPAMRTRLQIVRALGQQPKTVATVADPTTPESYRQAESSGDFGSRPLIVLTRGKDHPSAHPTAMDQEGAAYDQLWMHEIQPKLARMSTRGRQIIVTRSGHDIPDEAPDEVIAAVREVVADVRDAQAPSSVGHSATDGKIGRLPLLVPLPPTGGQCRVASVNAALRRMGIARMLLFEAPSPKRTVSVGADSSGRPMNLSVMAGIRAGAKRSEGETVFIMFSSSGEVRGGNRLYLTTGVPATLSEDRHSGLLPGDGSAGLALAKEVLTKCPVTP